MTELIWQGKYDENSKRTAPLRVSPPFQTVESINESTIECQRMWDLFSTDRDSDWCNGLRYTSMQESVIFRKSCPNADFSSMLDHICGV
ncbi:MAG TPA: hypothetical protein VF918_06240 [Anaerolineales bacterium]